ncbi:MAG: hypothetical protein HWD61_09810 [Parachlamydiaceae bacterium]|nr:MAG: hypothetical protein HWD61_09810 [Parachlamydiaceae bacterium]
MIPTHMNTFNRIHQTTSFTNESEKPVTGVIYKYIESGIEGVVRFISQHPNSEIYQVSFSNRDGIRKIIVKGCDDSDMMRFLKYYKIPVKDELDTNSSYEIDRKYLISAYRTSNPEICKRLFEIFLVKIFANHG